VISSKRPFWPSLAIRPQKKCVRQAIPERVKKAERIEKFRQTSKRRNCRSKNNCQIWASYLSRTRSCKPTQSCFGIARSLHMVLHRTRIDHLPAGQRATAAPLTALRLLANIPQVAKPVCQPCVKLRVRHFWMMSVYGSREQALAWLRKSHPRLNGRTPLSLLKTDAGSRIVEELRIQIDEGMFV
jgi:hypothetical protein